MASGRSYRLISADSHLEIPPDDFLPYVPEAYRDRAPRRINTGDGGDSWLVEGVPVIHTGANLTAGQKVQQRGKSYWNPDGTRATGGGLATQRLEEQDVDGVDAEVLFPPIFTKDALAGITDVDAYHAIIQGYNTFIAQDYSQVAPDRLIPLGVIPSRTLDGAVAELKRCAELGLKGICLIQFPNGGPVAKPEDDRFWEAALELGMPVSAHTHFGAAFPPFVTGPQAGAHPLAGSLCNRQALLRPQWTVAQLIATGVFDRFPELQIYFAETNASWLPTGLQQYDENYQTYEHIYPKLPKAPSQYWRDHIFVSFIMDPMVGRMLDLLPIDNLMWGSDFPHSVGSWPNSRHWLEQTFGSASEEVQRKLTSDNVAKFYKLDQEPKATPTESVATASA
jgi:predicted TIM-barrel fold metal-dependent hydrolase